MPSPGNPSNNPPHLRLVRFDEEAVAAKLPPPRVAVATARLEALATLFNSARFDSEKGGQWSEAKGIGGVENFAMQVSLPKGSPSTALLIDVRPGDRTQEGLTRIALEVRATDGRWASSPFRLNEFGLATTFVVPRGGIYTFHATVVDEGIPKPAPAPRENHTVLLQPAQAQRLLSALGKATLSLESSITFDDRVYGQTPEGFAQPPQGLPPALMVHLAEGSPRGGAASSGSLRVVELTFQSFPWMMKGWEAHEIRVVPLKGGSSGAKDAPWKALPSEFTRERVVLQFSVPERPKCAEFQVQVRATNVTSPRLVV